MRGLEGGESLRKKLSNIFIGPCNLARPGVSKEVLAGLRIPKVLGPLRPSDEQIPAGLNQMSLLGPGDRCKKQGALARSWESVSCPECSMQRPVLKTLPERSRTPPVAILHASANPNASSWEWPECPPRRWWTRRSARGYDAASAPLRTIRATSDKSSLDAMPRLQQMAQSLCRPARTGLRHVAGTRRQHAGAVQIFSGILGR